MTTTQRDEHPTDLVERHEQVRERPLFATPGAQNVNVGATTASSVWTITNVVTLVFTVLGVVLLLRFLFRLTGAKLALLIVALLRAIAAPQRV